MFFKIILILTMEIYCNKNKIMKTSTYIFPFLSLYLFILTLHKFVRNGMRYNFTLYFEKKDPYLAPIFLTLH